MLTLGDEVAHLYKAFGHPGLKFIYPTAGAVELLLQVVALLGRSSLLSLRFVISRALGVLPNIVLLKSVRCKCTSQAGCADALHLRNVSLWTSAPANAGLGLAVLTGQATGSTKCGPEGILEQSGRT